MILESTELRREFHRIVQRDNLDIKKLCRDTCPSSWVDKWLERKRTKLTEKNLIDICGKIGIFIRIQVVLKNTDTSGYSKEKDIKGYRPINTGFDRNIERLSARCKQM